MRVQTGWVLALLVILAIAVGCGGDDKNGGENGNGREKGKADATSYEKPGFKTEVKNGILWVFREGSDDLAEFEKSGEPAKNATSIGTGPNGLSIRSGDMDTIKAYLAAK